MTYAQTSTQRHPGTRCAANENTRARPLGARYKASGGLCAPPLAGAHVNGLCALPGRLGANVAAGGAPRARSRQLRASGPRHQARAQHRAPIGAQCLPADPAPRQSPAATSAAGRGIREGGWGSCAWAQHGKGAGQIGRVVAVPLHVRLGIDIVGVGGLIKAPPIDGLSRQLVVGASGPGGGDICGAVGAICRDPALRDMRQHTGEVAVQGALEFIAHRVCPRSPGLIASVCGCYTQSADMVQQENARAAKFFSRPSIPRARPAHPGAAGMSAFCHNVSYATAPQILAQSSHNRSAPVPAPGREDLRDASKTSAAEARIERGIT